MKMFFGVFLVFSLGLFLAQFVGIDVSSQPDFVSKSALLIDQVDWILVFGVALTAAALVTSVSLLKHTPIGKALDSRDE
ncbi:hypothetical protein ACFOOP_09375 [Marinicaulis aureus]|uniref:Uncharacterized protein n=1 Tax=Hyphococcus aureus TaxID=2666033 RepID=A0ABW1KU06_9PROT